MSSSESVSEWLQNLKQRDSYAAQCLWQRYVERLIRLAHRKLGNAARRVADEEDVVVAAFASFCRGAEAGRFSKLDDRDDLWQVLVVLTERKAIDQMRREQAAKRGAGDVRGESVFAGDELDDASVAGLAQVVDGEPNPEFAARVTEQLERLLASLGDDTRRRIALARMEGYTNEEIAQLTGTSLRTVERRLSLIRQIWERSLRDEQER